MAAENRYLELKAMAGEISAMAFQLFESVDTLRKKCLRYYSAMRWEETGCNAVQYEELLPLVRLIGESSVDVMFTEMKGFLETVEAKAGPRPWKLRLLVTEECHRNCPGCCNQDYDLEALPVCTDFSLYREIFLTGGEPMLDPAHLKSVIIKDIRSKTDAPIYLYTALTQPKEALGEVLDMIDGITVTLHDESDIGAFRAFDAYYERTDKSFRLNVFEEAGPIDYNVKPRWKIKANMKWAKNCPLPTGEVLMRCPEKPVDAEFGCKQNGLSKYAKE